MPSLRQRVFDRRGRDHSQRMYDWWGSHDWAYRLFVNGYLLGREATFRRRTITSLDLAPGDHVLDVGCGPGPNFPRLADAVELDGSVVGVDLSRGMVARAAERSETLDCDSAVLRADATRLPLQPESVDAACATLSLSAMPDVGAVLDEVHRVLRPGGRLAILDMRPFQTPLFGWLNPLVESAAAYLTNWYPETDIVDIADDTFAETTVEAFHGGTVYVSTSRKHP